MKLLGEAAHLLTVVRGHSCTTSLVFSSTLITASLVMPSRRGTNLFLLFIFSWWKITNGVCVLCGEDRNTQWAADCWLHFGIYVITKFVLLINHVERVSPCMQFSVLISTPSLYDAFPQCLQSNGLFGHDYIHLESLTKT